MNRWTVGQRVMVIDVNRGPAEGTVIKVGRTIVQVEPDNYRGHWWAFRMDDGSRNDNYGHQHILTMEEFADREERAALMKRIKAAGFDTQFGYRREHTTALLRRVVQALEDQ